MSHRWQITVCIATGLVVAGCVLFAVYGRSTPEPAEKQACEQRIAQLAERLQGLSVQTFNPELLARVPPPRSRRGEALGPSGPLVVLGPNELSVDGRALSPRSGESLMSELERGYAYWASQQPAQRADELAVHFLIDQRQPVGDVLPWLRLAAQRWPTVLVQRNGALDPSPPARLRALADQLATQRADRDARFETVAGGLGKESLGCGPLWRTLSGPFGIARSALIDQISANLRECACRSVDLDGLGYLLQVMIAGDGAQYNGLPLRIEPTASLVVSARPSDHAQQLFDRLAAMPRGPVRIDLGE